MTFVFDIVSILVIICLLGAMLYVSKAIKAGRKQKTDEKKAFLRTASFFGAGYIALNILRLFLESKMG
jgi:hypothetical protein